MLMWLIHETTLLCNQAGLTEAKNSLNQMTMPKSDVWQNAAEKKRMTWSSLKSHFFAPELCSSGTHSSRPHVVTFHPAVLNGLGTSLLILYLQYIC